MIGSHSVVAYSDRNAAGWGAPLFTNSYFDTDMNGWQTGPFSPAWTWASGAVTCTYVGAGSQLVRTQAGVINRPPNVSAYRVRVTVTVSHTSNVFLNLYFGKTRIAAQQGPYWQPADSVQQWTARHIEPGTTTFEGVLNQTAPPGSEYIYLGIAAGVYPSPDIPGVSFTCSISSLEVHYQSQGTSADISCLIDEVSILHGRDTASGQPTASAATIDFTATPEAPLPALVDIGAVIIVNTMTPEASFTRFTGRVTDIALGWDDAGDDTPYSGVGQIMAVSLMADLARRVVGDVPWPQELDGARVSRIADQAGEPLDPRWSDPGTVQILPRDVDNRAALELITGVAESANGMLWQTRNGEIRYADAVHRRGIPSSLLLDACDILVTPQWLRNLEGLINEVSIGYGVPATEGGDQPRYVASDANSIARYGRYEYSLTTELAALADATALGQLLLVRNSAPVWILTTLPVDLAGFDQTRTNQVLGLEMHSLMQVTGLPAIGTAPTTASLWVEGWRERLAYGVHELELSVSGYCRTAPPPRWNDLSPSLTWDTVSPASLQWDQTSCLGPLPPSEIWDAVPASTRWDAVAPAVTWDSYKPVLAGG